MSSPETEPHNTERDIFLQALECSTPEERSKFLDEACANNPPLRAAIEVLLQNHKEDAFLETPQVVAQSSGKTMDDRRKTILIEIVGERPGDTVGRYKLLQQIGEGGVGVVFMAEQESPVRRRVAVKVLKPGLDTKSVITRFESERQALALMDHPHIAKVFDAGSTAAGRPYFVMELVRGVRITEYCDQNRLPTRERAALFIQVCQAIQHAHQKGIIHRDIKPSNILVTLHDGVPMPKVIDFGIAKAIDQRLTDKTLFTEFQCFIGTPAYISPEQAEMSGLDIDTRADIYSLGVLLYELLTGKTPFDAQELWSSGLDGMRRTIREQEPTRPSTRLATLPEAERTTTAQRQQVEPAKLTSLLRVDLDWIVLKALEKDRTRRYATANDLAQDIRRYLDHEPILARPPTATYRFQKLVRRNKLLFAGVGAFTAALVIGLAFSTWQFVEKNAAYRRMVSAEQEQSRLRRGAEAARQSAEIQALAARRDAYAADMNLAQQALAANNLGRAQELLNRHRPMAKAQSQQRTETAAVLDSPVATDLRGWEWRYLWQQCQSDALFTLCQLSNEVHAFSVSHDGKWVAIGQNGTNGVSIWDLRARQEITRFTPGGDQQPFAFSPIAPLLAVSWKEERPNLDDPARTGSRVRLWDVGTRRIVGDFAVSGFCNAVAFSADGARLLTASSDGQVTIWSVAERAVLASHTVSKPRLSGGAPPFAFAGHIAVSRDLNLVAQALGGGQIRVIELASNRELWTAHAAEENVTVLAFSPDGTRLASGAGFVESAVRLWDVASGRELAHLEGHRTYVRALVFWPDGEKLASASGDQTIHLWDLTSLESLPSLPTSSGSVANRPESGPQHRWRRTRIPELKPHATLRGHHLEVWSLALCPDNSTLVSGSKDGSVYVWDTGTLRRERGHLTLPVELRAWSFGPDSQTILALDDKGRVGRWQGVEFQQSQPLVEVETNSISAHFSADGRFIAAVSPKGVTGVWDLSEGRFWREVGSKEERNLPVAFLPRSNHLVTHQPREGVFREWDVTTGREVRSWRFTAPGFRWTCDFSADEQWFVGLSGDGTGQLRNLASGQQTRLDLNLKGVANAAFSPDGRLLAVVSNLGMGQLWETATMQQVATLEGFLQGAHSASFSPDGRRLAIGSNGNEAVKLWDVEALQELVTLKGHGSLFDSVAFSPDGNALASRNRRGILHIWRAPSFEDIARLEALGR